MSLAAIPAAESERLAAELRPVFPQFQPAASVFETSLNATNPIFMRRWICFLARTDKRGVLLLLYVTARRRSASGISKKIDAERMAVIRAMGIHGQSCLEIVNDAWSAGYTDLLEGLLDVKATRPAWGLLPRIIATSPRTCRTGSARSRSLGRRYGRADAPYGCAILTIYALALDLDIAASVPDFSTLDPAALL